MSGITHKQAQRFIRASADDILEVDKRCMLEEHLTNCGSCRTYAAELETVQMKFQKEFHAHWEGQRGPSHLSIPYVQSRGRRIIMSNHLISGLKMVGAIAVIGALALAINYGVPVLKKTSLLPLSAASSEKNELIAFTSREMWNNDIYTVKVDGSGLTNLTNNPADDSYPVWSPDGKRIAFVSDRTGIQNIYAMDSDGSNVVQLTDSSTRVTAPAWSPDGTKIAYISGDWDTMKMNMYVMDSDGNNQRTIVEKPAFATVFPDTWSPDSQWIAYETNNRIFRVGVNGGPEEPITQEAITYGISDYAWSNDGSKIMYLAGCPVAPECYALHSIRVDGSEDTTIAEWQIPGLCQVNNSPPTWIGIWTKWSPEATKVMLVFTCEDSGWIYIGNTDGSDFRSLTNYPVVGNAPSGEVMTADWSPDGQSIAFLSALNTDQTVSIYTMNVSEALSNPAMLPTFITGKIVRDSNISGPVWQPVP